MTCELNPHYGIEQEGRDFWFSRNGQEVGFWTGNSVMFPPRLPPIRSPRALPDHVESRDRKGIAQFQRVGACPCRKSRATFSGHALAILSHASLLKYFLFRESLNGRGADFLVNVCDDCGRLKRVARKLLKEKCPHDKPHYGIEQAGRDFWFSRNGQGVGFWDRGLGDVDVAAKIYGESTAYAGDDGKLLS